LSEEKYDVIGTRCQLYQHFISSFLSLRVFQSFSLVTVSVRIFFCRKEIGAKSARQMLLKMITGFFFSEHSMSLVEANDLKLVVTRETGSRTGPHHPLHPPNVRPLIIGGGLVGLTLSSFLYLLPSLQCTTTFHPFLATIYLMSALSAPLIASVMVTNAILYNGPTLGPLHTRNF